MWVYAAPRPLSCVWWFGLKVIPSRTWSVRVRGRGHRAFAQDGTAPSWSATGRRGQGTGAAPAPCSRGRDRSGCLVPRPMRAQFASMWVCGGPRELRLPVRTLRHRPGDVLWALATSGRSPKVAMALEVARMRGLTRVLITGENGGGASPTAPRSSLPSRRARPRASRRST